MAESHFRKAIAAGPIVDTQSMRKSLSKRCGQVLLLLCAGLASGKQLPTQDIPTSGLSPEVISALPLAAPQRVALQEPYRSRNYPSAETLLMAEIERNLKSAELLTVLGTIFFWTANI